MDIKEVIRVVSELQSNGLIEGYAIGGAVGATFYLEPVATLDVDVFVSIHPQPGSVVLNPQPIFDYLRSRGCAMKGEYVIIGNWPVQFLPPPGLLGEEALAESVTIDVEGTPVRVFTAEHLAALALQTGRAKDKARLLQFIEAGVLDAQRLRVILTRHQLVPTWERFQRQFLEDRS